MSFDITIYKPANLTVNVVDGDPPVDQTALVAQLTQDLANMTAARDAAVNAGAALQTKITNAQAALA